MTALFRIFCAAAFATPALAVEPLSKYTHIVTYPLNDVSEASGITYNWDTDTLFAIGDEGEALVQVRKNGETVDRMNFDYYVSPRSARALDDSEGVAYVGNNTFLIADERDFMARATTYVAGALRTQADVNPTSYSFDYNGTFASESTNTGLEDVAYDPIDKALWGLKELGPVCIFKALGIPQLPGNAGVPFSVFEPIARRDISRWETRPVDKPLGITSLSGMYALSACKAFAENDPRRMNLLLLARDSRKIIEVTRDGTVVDSLDISSIGRGTIEGITVDSDGVIYLASEQTVAPNNFPGLHVLTPPPSTYTLQLLHLADEEAGLLASQTAPNLAALVDGFDGAYPNTLILSGGDSFIPSPFLNGGTDPSLSSIAGIGATAFGRPDYAILNAIGVEASAIGNHEWDLGSAVFADAIRPASPWTGAQFPHITSNLDFSGDTAISGANAISVNVPVDGSSTAVPEASGLKGKIVPTAVVTKGGEKIGLVGVTTQLIESISSPSGTRVKGFAPKMGADDMNLLASQLQPFIDELTAEGVNKIILLSHLQQITNEQLLATKLHGVDIILAAGSNTRLGDADDAAATFPGHSASFTATYPLRTQGNDGKPTLIVCTDNEFTYLGRLVVDFTPGGEVIPASLDSRVALNGAYAATPANVATAWNTTIANLPSTAFAAGTKGAKVKAITDAVQTVIAAKDGLVHGYTKVYLEGERWQVRSEETNLGDITADANAGALRAIIGGTAPIVSLKNGGGIRAQIGAVSSAGGSSQKLPPPANPSVGKLEGGISQLDIENALRFDNKLIAFQTTPAGLKAILEQGVALWPNQGRFPQVGGVSFAWDPAFAAGSRIRTISLTDQEGAPEAAIYANGTLLSNAPATITMVTLNFLANDGDGYPMKANGENFRYLLADGSLGPVLNKSLDFTVSPSLPVNPVGEQKVFASYLASRHPSVVTAYATADTAASADLRVQTLGSRSNSVLPYTPSELWTLNNYADALRSLGLKPGVALTSPSLVAAIGNTREDGQADVINHPGTHGLYTEDSIQDLRGTGVLIRVQGTEVKLSMPIEKSVGLGSNSWQPAATLEATLPKEGDKQFFRLVLPQ